MAKLSSLLVFILAAGVGVVLGQGQLSVSDRELEILNEECLDQGLVLSRIDYQCHDLATRNLHANCQTT